MCSTFKLHAFRKLSMWTYPVRLPPPPSLSTPHQCLAKFFITSVEECSTLLNTPNPKRNSTNIH